MTFVWVAEVETAGQPVISKNFASFDGKFFRLTLLNPDQPVLQLQVTFEALSDDVSYSISGTVQDGYGSTAMIDDEMAFSPTQLSRVVDCVSPNENADLFTFHITIRRVLDVTPGSPTSTFPGFEFSDTDFTPSPPSSSTSEDEVPVETKVEPESEPKPVPFVGLKNQGCTCYMNSILQSLFHLPAFRRLVYSFPTTGTEDPMTNSSLNLQRLFSRMQLGKTTVSTKSLTRSFGWGDVETFIQHDIHEFCRVLMDNIERKLKGSRYENSISDLFRGKFISFIRCKNVTFSKSREEEFYDLQMMVRGKPTLRDSFAAYVEKEELMGENQYETDDFGKQDAEMGTEFIQFPKVLQLHLHRFDYDFEEGKQVKINDRFEFPSEIDLAEFLALTAPSQPTCFQLVGVLVHEGAAYSGHYYAFLRPSPDPQWYEFDDDTVRRAIPQEAIDNNFGGKKRKQGWRSARDISGYFLVYVRVDALDKVFQPIDDVPAHLREYVVRFEAEREGRKRREAIESTQMIITLIDDSVLRENTSKLVSGFDATGACHSIQLDQSALITEVVAAIQDKYRSQELRIWRCNRTPTPNQLLSPTAEGLFDARGFGGTVYVERGETKELTSEEIQIWAKFYFHLVTSPLQFIGTFCVNMSDPVSMIFPAVCRRVGFPENSSLIVYEENLRSLPLVVDQSESFWDNRIVIGSILIFQQSPGMPYLMPEGIEIFERQLVTKESIKEEIVRYPNVTTLLATEVWGIERPETVSSYLSFNIELYVISVFLYPDAPMPLFHLKFPSSASLAQLKDLIARAGKFDYDPAHNHLLLYRRDQEGCVSEMPISATSTPYSLFSDTYKPDNMVSVRVVKGVSERESEDVVYAKVRVSHNGYQVDEEVIVSFVSSAKRRGLIEALVRIETIEEDDPVRILEEWNHRISRIIQRDSDLYITTSYPVRVDVVPEDQRGENTPLIGCWHGTVDKFGYYDAFGCPFYLAVIEGEVFAQTKQRLKAILQIEEEQFAQLQFHLNATYTRSGGRELTDRDVLSHSSWSAHRALIIVHPKAEQTGAVKGALAKKESASREEAVRIYN
jgi:ubiquitin C-terminal hydrolase